MNKVRFNSMSGAVIVEFAIIMPLLVLLVFGITELGRALYQWNTLTKAVAIGARYMARSNGNLINDECVENKGADGTWVKHETTAKNLIVYGQMAAGDPLLPGLQVTTIESAKQAYDYGNACVIIIEATADFESIFGGSRLPSIYGALGDGNKIILRSRTEERYIGE
jgi:hypothetical protein